MPNILDAIANTQAHGYSSDEIVNYLISNNQAYGPKLKAALGAGYSPDEVIKYLSSNYVPNAATSMQSELDNKRTSLVGNVGTYNPNWQQSQAQKDLDTSAGRPQTETGFWNNFHPWQAVTKPIPQWVNHMNNPYQTSTAPGGGVEDAPFATAAVKAGTQLADGDIAGAAGTSGDTAVQALATVGALKYGPKYAGRAFVNSPAVARTGARMVGQTAVDMAKSPQAMLGAGIGGASRLLPPGFSQAGEALGAMGLGYKAVAAAVKNGTMGEFWGSMKDLFTKETPGELDSMRQAEAAKDAADYQKLQQKMQNTQAPEKPAGLQDPIDTNLLTRNGAAKQSSQALRTAPSEPAFRIDPETGSLQRVVPETPDFSRFGPAKSGSMQDWSPWAKLKAAWQLGKEAPNGLLQNIATNSQPPASLPSGRTPGGIQNQTAETTAPNSLLQNIVENSTLGNAGKPAANGAQTTQAASPNGSGPFTSTTQFSMPDMYRQVQAVLQNGTATPAEITSLEKAVATQDPQAVQAALDKIHGNDVNHSVYVRTGGDASAKTNFLIKYFQEHPELDIRDSLAKTGEYNDFVQGRNLSKKSISDQLNVIRVERPDLLQHWDDIHALGKDVIKYFNDKGQDVNKTNSWFGISHSTLKQVHEGLTGQRWTK